MSDVGVKRNSTSKKVTLGDIADELGVARSTVSNAYNRPDQLSSALRQKILTTAQRLGYSGPDPLARSLRRGVTHTLGVVYTSELSYAFTDPAASLLLRGIAVEAEREGYTLLLVGGPIRDAQTSQRPTAPVTTANVDGLIVHCIADDDPLLQASLERNLPTVMVDNRTVGDVPWVTVDDVGGARRAAEHVLSLGHRRIGVASLGMGLSGTGGIVGSERQRRAAYAPTRLRLQGYQEAVAAAGLAWDRDVRVYECADNTVADGRTAAASLLGTDPEITAILAMSDQYATGILAHARAHGIRVPDDLSVVGYDDVPGASHTHPPLTTVRQPLLEKGVRAADILLAQLRSEPFEGSVTLPTELVVRATTAPRP